MPATGRKRRISTPCNASRILRLSLRLCIPGLLAAIALLSASGLAHAQTGYLLGRVLDPNWYAKYWTDVYGVGQYEFAVYGNGTGISSVGAHDDTDIYGSFTSNAVAAGTYVSATWSNWWRPTFNFGLNANGPVYADLRLKATMWGYPAFWDDACFATAGQTFVATGTSVSMLLVKIASNSSATVRFREGGPAGSVIGPSRSINGAGDHRLIYSAGEVSTTPGETYYVEVTANSGCFVPYFLDPIPDYSDPMPGGMVWLNGSADPRRDLGVLIMSDDDGLLTNIYLKSGGSSATGTSVGQTLTARGTSLISCSAWIPDTFGTYAFTPYASPNGAQIGPTKRQQVARAADPEIMALWSPGEVPLTPGGSYYIEITRDGGGSLSAYSNVFSLYAGGQAHANRNPLGSSIDLAMTVMEEEAPGSAAKPSVAITVAPHVDEVDRKPGSLVVRWTTNVASTGMVEYAADTPPYTSGASHAGTATQHAVTLTGLKANTMYHFRATSTANGYKDITSRDIVIVTRPNSRNLLVNPDFEQGSGGSPRATITGWTKGGSVDIKASDGTWFWGIPAQSGGWFVEGAVNGSASDGFIYQRVPTTAGLDHTFSAWVTTWHRENDTWKYDVWQQRGRLIYMRLGIDPLGGTDPNSASVRWTPRMYSHLRYTNLAITQKALSSHVTVFVSMKGEGGQWHLYGVDNCALTASVPESTLHDVKGTTADGLSVSFPNAVVSAVTSAGTPIYVQALDRSSGIRVQSAEVVAEGTVVTVSGGTATLASGERVLENATFSNPVPGQSPEPLAMQPLKVGGSEYGTQIPPVPDSAGLHNTGLLVEVFGTVTQVGDGFFYLNDGSLTDPGLRIDASALFAMPEAGDFVTVTGNSSLWKNGGSSHACVRPRRDADVVQKL